MIKSNYQERQDIEKEHQIQFLRKIGEGSFGKVYEALDLQENHKVAVKVIIQTNSKKVSRENFHCEQYFLQTLEHPHIVPFKKVSDTHYVDYRRDQFSLFGHGIDGGGIIEIAIKGSIQKSYKVNRRRSQSNNALDPLGCRIHASKKHYPSRFEDRQQFIGYIDNILLQRKRDLNTIKIVDFGLSYQFQNNKTSYKLTNGKCGTFHFMAPEQLKGQQYTKPVDIWSCGIIMHILLTGGKHPFAIQDETREQYIQDIDKRELKSDIGSTAQDLLRRLLTINPYDRYSAGQALIHPWISRRFTDSVPLNVGETRQIFATNLKLAQVIKILIFLQVIKKTQVNIKQASNFQLEKYLNSLVPNQFTISQEHSHQIPFQEEKSEIDEVIEPVTVTYKSQPRMRSLVETSQQFRIFGSPQNKRISQYQCNNPKSMFICIQGNNKESENRIANFRRTYQSKLVMGLSEKSTGFSNISGSPKKFNQILRQQNNKYFRSVLPPLLLSSQQAIT